MALSKQSENSENKRFVALTNEEIECLDAGKDSASTKRIIARSVKLFRSFLGPENELFEDMPKYAINNNLRLFFASIRTSKGEELKKSSLYSIKYGLSKYMKETCGIDISTDQDFSTSKKTFQAKLKDLQKKGKGSVEHKNEVADNDLKKLMEPNSKAFCVETPYGLQYKVWFDIMFHFCRRGRENLRQMSKSTFAVETDSSGREFVYQVLDEADKNHGAESTPDDTIGESRMYAYPELKGMCPVQCFKKYLCKLNPKSDDLWQKPRDSFHDADEIWHCNCPLGKNTLSNMMSNISSAAKLSKRYTNHCIRATSIAALDRAGFEARHIIRATGHKSETSIKSYSKRLSEGNKRSMSEALSTALLPKAEDTQNPSDVDLQLTVEELDSLFSPENDFVEVPVSRPTAEPSTSTTIPQIPVIPPVSVVSTVPSVQPVQTAGTCTFNNFTLDQQMNVPQILNFPPSNETSGILFNVAPNISNSTINFNFYGKS